jgi:hypothetical protein
VDKDESTSIRSAVDEHEGCMQGVVAIEHCLDREPDLEGRWLAELTAKLSEVRQQLADHFEIEEQGPLYRELPIRYPHLADSIERLLKEHPMMLEQTGAAIAHAERLQSPELYELRELSARTQLLVARIRRHEAEENEMAFSAMWDEMGTGD